MRKCPSFSSFMAMLLVSACDGGASEPTTPVPAAAAEVPSQAEPPAREATVELDARVQKVAALAAQIEAEPERADALLAAANLDRDQLDALVREISTDPALVEQYRVARAR